MRISFVQPLQLAFHFVGTGSKPPPAPLLFWKWFLVWNKVVENLSFACNLNGFLKKNLLEHFILRLFVCFLEMPENTHGFDFAGWPKLPRLILSSYRPVFIWIIEKLNTIPWHRSLRSTIPFISTEILSALFLMKRKTSAFSSFAKWACLLLFMIYVR